MLFNECEKADGKLTRDNYHQPEPMRYYTRMENGQRVEVMSFKCSLCGLTQERWYPA